MTLFEKFLTRPPMFWLPSDVREITGNQELTNQECNDIIDQSLKEKAVFDFICKTIKKNSQK